MNPDPRTNNSNEQWLSMAEASKLVPYSSEYLSLLARKGKLPSKKIGNVWYTTESILHDYMKKQMIRAQVQNGNIDAVKPLIESQTKKSSSLAPVRTYYGDLKELGVDIEPPLASTEQGLKDHEKESLFSNLKKMWSKDEFEPTVFLPAIDADEKKLSHTGSVFSELGRSLPAWLAERKEKHEEESQRASSTREIQEALERVIDQKLPAERLQSPVSRVSHRRLVYREIFASKTLVAVMIVSVLSFTILPVPVVFSFFERSLGVIKDAWNDSNTVMGFRPGTHANEILLLDKEGNVSIMGHIETEGQLRSFVAEGVAPIVVDSTTMVENLNAEFLGGASSTDFTLAFVTANGNVTTEDVYLEGRVEVGQTLKVRGATELLSTLSVGGELKVFGKAEFRQALDVLGPAYFESLVTLQSDLKVKGDIRSDGNISTKNINVRGGVEAGTVLAKSGSFSSLGVAGNFSAGGKITLGNSKDDVLITAENVTLDKDGNVTFAGAINGASFSGGNVVFTNSTTTNATTTNFFSTTLRAVTGTITSLISDDISVGALTATNSTTTNATSTNLFSTNATFTNLTASTQTITDLIFTRATGTSATTTNFFSTTASSTNLFSSLLTVGGTGLVVDASRNVGIGTTTPGQKLDVEGNIRVNNKIYANADDTTYIQLSSNDFRVIAGNAVLGTFGSGNIVRLGASNAFNILANGNVGIASTSPTHKLSVEGTSSLGNQATAGFFTATTTTDSVFPRFTFTNATGTSATTTSFFSTTASSTNLFSTSFNLGAGLFGNATGTNIFTTTSSSTNLFSTSGNIAMLTLGSATSTNIFSTTASSTNLYSTNFNLGSGSIGSLTAANLLATGSTTLQNFTFVNATGTSATTTNFFSTTASSTNLFSSLLTVGGTGLVVDASRNVGIGTTTPGGKLEVHGGDIVLENNRALQFRNASGGLNWFAISANTSNKLQISANNASMTLDGVTGNVGIATSSPQSPLHVYRGSDGTTLRLERTPKTAVGQYQDLSFYDGTTEDSRIRAEAFSGGNHGLAFWTYNSGSLTEKMRITGTGNVGIGTTTPTYKLSVDSATDTVLNINSTNASGDSRLRFTNSADGTSWFIGGDDDGVFRLGHNDATKLTIDASDNLTYSGGNATFGDDLTINISDSNADPGNPWIRGNNNYLVINSSAGGALYLNQDVAQDIYFNQEKVIFKATTGYVGIGTTSPQNLLHVNGSSDGLGYIRITDSVTGSMSTDGLRIGYNSGALRFQNYENSNISFFTNNTTEAVTIKNDGNVGIGTTTPQASLHVDGASGAGIVQIGNNAGANQYQYVNFGGNTAGQSAWQIGKANQSATLAPSEGFYVYDLKGSATRLAIAPTTGNVGIGAIAPAYPLSVAFSDTNTTQASLTGMVIGNTNTTANNGSAIVFGYGGTSMNSHARIGAIYEDRTGSSEDTSLFFGTIGGGSYGERMRISSTGNVGIGLTSPQKTLDVLGPTNDFVTVAASTLSVGNFTGIHFGYRENNTSYRKSAIVFERKDEAGGGADGTIHILNDGTNDSSSATLADARLSIRSNGYIGIGTTTPDHTLTVRGTTRWASTGTTNPIDYRWIITGPTSDYDTLYLSGEASTDANSFGANGDGNSIISFKAKGENEVGIGYDAGATAHTAKLSVNGNVGIGTSTPQAKLHANSSSAGIVQLITTGTTGAVYTQYQNTSTGYNSTSDGLTIGYNSGGTIWNRENTSLNFGTNNLERMTILSGGNVGVGTTTPWGQLSASSTSAYPTLAVQQSGSGPLATFLGSGNFGIGTTSPTVKFSVGGNAGDTTGHGYFTGGLGVGTVTTTPGVLQTSGNAYIGGTITVAGTLTSSVTNGQIQFLGTPSGTGINQGTVYINPASAGTNNVLLGLAVNGTEKARIDAEGDVQIVGLFNSTNTSGTNSLSGSLSVLGNTTLGDASTDTVTVNSTVSSDLIPTTDNTYSLGAVAKRWSTFYATSAFFDSITTSSSTEENFIINSDNATADTEDSSLQFERGTLTPNAILKWDSANDRFDFNDFPVRLQNKLIVSGTASSSFAGPLWVTGSPQGTGLRDASLYINPGSAAANQSLFSVGVADVERFRIDAEGDTRVQASLGVENTLYDITEDTLTLDDKLQLNGNEIKDSTGTTRLSIGATNAFTGNLTISGNSTTTHATTTSIFGTTGTFTNLFGTSANLTDLIFTRATGTSATTTNFFSTTASSTNLFSSLLTVGGTGLVVDASRNVGIGTTNPGGRLHSVGTNTIHAGIFESSNASTDATTDDPVVEFANTNTTANNWVKTYFTDTVGGAAAGILGLQYTDHTNDYGDFALFTRSAATGLTEKMRITGGGNVGIGTTTPYNTLQIGAAHTSLTSSDGNKVAIYGTAGSPASSGMAQGGILRVGNASPNTSIDFGTYSASPFAGWIQVTQPTNLANNFPLALNPNGGSVGIGTTTPQASLHVDGASGAGIVQIGNNAGANQYQYVNFGGNTAGQSAWQIGKANQSATLAPSEGFYVYDLKGSATRLAIAPTTGNVGIGTTNPRRILEVKVAADKYFSVAESSSGTGTSIYSTNDADAYNILQVDGSSLLLNTRTAGNVGIGTTTPNNKLDIYSTTKSAIGFSGASGSTYKWTIGMDVSNGGRFSIASSTALGTTDRFVINGAGNVGINTSAPNNMLHLYGTGTTNRIQIGSSSNFGNGYIGFYSDGVTNNNDILGFGVNAENSLVVEYGGNVGIGTTSPWGKLSVTNTGSDPSFVVADDASDTSPFVVTAAGDVAIGSTSAQGWRLLITASGPTTPGIFTQGYAAFGGGLHVGGSSNAGDGNLIVDGTITATGGLTSLSNLLLTGSTTLQNLTFVNATGTSATTTNFYSTTGTFGSLTTSSLINSGLTAGRVVFATTSGQLADSSLFTFDSASGKLTTTYASTTALSSSGSAYLATSGGSVGIGTTLPVAKLTVDEAKNGTGTGDGIVARLQGANAVNARSELGFSYSGASSGTYTPALVGYQSTTHSGFTSGLLYLATRSVTTDTAPTKRLVIAPDGKVGIGDSTPSLTEFQVTGSSYISGGLGVGDTNINTGVVNVGTGFRIANAAASGNVLRGNGTNFVSSASAALTKVDDTNVTLTLGGTPTTALLDAVSLTLGWTGQLSVPRGGTGAATLTSNGVLYGNGTGAIQATAQGGANTILTANNGAPSFSASPTIGTSVTTPLIIGGTAADSSLTLRSTSGSGTTDHIKFQVGNNGATEAMRIVNSGRVGVGTSDPRAKLVVEHATTSTTVGDGVAARLQAANALNARTELGFTYSGASGAYTPVVVGYQPTTFSGSTKGNFYIATRDATTDTTPTERLTVLPDGNVGIGTTTPVGKLHVYSGSAGGGTVNSSTDDLVIEGAGATGITILTPEANSGFLTFGTNTDTFGAYAEWSDTNNIFSLGSSQTGASTRITSGNAVEAIRINSSGNVGIGTITPGVKLQVNNSDGNTTFNSGVNTMLRLANPDTTAGNFAGIDFYNGSAASAGIYSIFTRTGTNDGELGFYTRSAAAAAAERLRINKDGNVGIGTTSPMSLLNVHNGNFMLTDADIAHGITDIFGSTATWLQASPESTTTGGANIMGVSTASATAGPLRLIGVFGEADPTDATAGVLLRAAKKSGTSWAAVGNSETVLQIANHGTALATVLGSGNVGIGTTSPASKFTVVSGNPGAGYPAFSGIHLSSDSVSAYTAYSIGRTGVDGYFAVSGAAGHYSTNSTAGDVIIRSESNDILFNTSGGTGTEILTLKSSNGNVGIGTASPGYKLQVNPTAANDGVAVYQGATQAAQLVYFGSTDEGYMSLKSGGADKVVLRANANSYLNGGNVGIGITTPLAQLHVANGVTTARIGIGPNDTAGNPIFRLGFIDAATDYSEIQTLNGTHLSLNPAGNNVGIGTTSPASILHAYTSTGAPLFLDGSSTAQPYISFRQANTERAYLQYTENGSSDYLRYDAPTHYFSTGNVGIGTTNPLAKFHVGSGDILLDYGGRYLASRNFAGTGNLGLVNLQTQGSNNNVMTLYEGKAVILSSGNVGIGTTTPASTLNIHGTTGFSVSRNTITPVLMTDLDNKLGGSDIYFSMYNNVASSNLGYIFSTDNSPGTAPQMVITTAGNVGIGTTSPQNLLHVNGSADGLGYIRISDQSIGSLSTDGARIGYNSGALRIQNYENSNISFFTNNTTEALTIKNDGNVGIGATDPQDKLHVSGSGSIRNRITSTNSTTQVIQYPTSGGAYWDQGTVGQSTYFRTSNSAILDTTALTILPSGNVGIGTTNPGFKLDVSGTLNSSGRITYGEHIIGGTPGGYMQVTGASSNAWAIGSTGGAAAPTTASTNFGIHNWNGTAWSVPVSITNTGNVGIGTTGPNYKLSLGNSLANIKLAIYDAGAGTGYGLGVQSNKLMFTVPTASTDRFAFYGGDGGPEVFSVLGTGNVGIGTTSPQELVHIQSSTSAKPVLRIENQNDDSAGSILEFYKATASAAADDRIGRIRALSYDSASVNRQAGAIDFITESVGSGFVNGAIKFSTFTSNTEGEKMRITNAGNVGIGTTSPSALLHVAGNGNPAAYIDSLNNGSPFLALRQSNAVRSYLQYVENGSSDYMEYYAPTHYFSTGNVGIGTTTSSDKLSVLTSAAVSSGGASGYLRFVSTGGTNYIQSGVSAATGSAAPLYFTSMFGNDNWMVLSSTGNVGIGTTTPYSYAGSTRTLTISAGTNGSSLGLESTAAGGGAYELVSSTSGGSRYFGLWDAAGSAYRLYVNSGGNVGIGTTTPTYKLSVDSATDTILNINSINAGGDSRLRFTNSTDGTSWFMGGDDDGVFRLGHNDATKLTIDSSDNLTYSGGQAYFTGGNVGIGTTTPASSLQIGNLAGSALGSSVGGNLLIGGSAAGRLGLSGSVQADIFLEDTGASANQKYSQLVNDSGKTILRAFDNNIAVTYNGLVFDHSNGNVGIGTTSPNVTAYDASARVLSVQGTNMSALELIGTRTSNGVVGDLNFINTSNSASDKRVGIIRVNRTGADNTADMSFFTSIAGSLAERMVISSAGNVGIGTTTPGAKLEIVANAIYNDPSSNAALHVVNSTAPSKQVRIGYDNSIDAGFIQSAQFGIGTKPLLLQAIGGNVGIGTTAPGAKLSVQNTGAAVTSLLLGNNSGNTGDYQQIAFQFSQTDNSYMSAIRSRVQEGGIHGGNLSFWTHQNGTTNLTERMTIDRVGNVGIGTTTPGARLHVAGGTQDIRIDGTTAGQYWQLQTGTGSLALKYDTGTAMTFLNSNGNVGIGTTTPGAKLEIVANAIYNDPSSNAALHVVNSTAPSKQVRIGYDNSIDAGFIQSAQFGIGTKPLLLQAIGGNVGIGTTTPDTLLTLNTSGSASQLAFNRAGVNQANIGVDTGGMYITSGATNQNLRFFRNNGGTETMRIDSSGNVGIGVASPERRLQVLSGSAASLGLGLVTSDFNSGTNAGTEFALSHGAATGNTYGQMQVFNAGRSTIGNLALQPSGGNVGIGTTSPNVDLEIYGSAAEARVTGSDANSVSLSVSRNQSGGSFNNTWYWYMPPSSTDMRLYSNGEKMTINTSGNVGIGTTSPSNLLHVAGNGTPAVLIDSLNSQSPFLSFRQANVERAYLQYTENGSSDYLRYEAPVHYFSTGNIGVGTSTPFAYGGFAPNLSLEGSAPSLILSDSGGAGDDFQIGVTVDDLHFLEAGVGTRMIIDQDGNVGIGTTNPTGGKLHVDGGSARAGYFISTNDAQISLNSNDTWAGIAFNDSGATDDYIWYNGANGTFAIGGGGSSVSGKKLHVDGGMSIGANSDATAAISNGLYVEGNVGIGTTTPGAKLELAASNQHLRLHDIDTTNVYWTQGIDNNADFAIWENTVSNANNRLMIKAGGNVGIASTTPFAQLAVENVGTGLSFAVNDQAADASPFVIDASGNVGIGTASPSAKLDVQGDDIEVGGGGGSAYLRFTPAASDTVAANITVNGTNRISILPVSGNVGIGTTTPQSELSIVGASAGMTELALYDNAGTLAGFKIRYDDATGATYLENIYNDAAGDIYFRTKTAGTAVDALFIESAGNVGIGTVSPSQKLQVHGSVGLPASSGTTQNGILRISQSSGAAVLDIGQNGAVGSWLQSTRSDNLSVYDPLLLNPNGGNVGIGTTGPGGKLDVRTARTSGANSTALVLSDAVTGVQTAGFGNTIQWSSNGGSSLAEILMGVGGTGTNNESMIRFRTQAIAGGLADRLTIDEAGEVGIGVTTPQNLLHIHGNAVMRLTNSTTGSTNADGLFLGNSASNEGNFDLWNYESGYLRFATANTERARINSSGNVMIGTTTPLASNASLTIAQANGTMLGLRATTAGAGGYMDFQNSDASTRGLFGVDGTGFTGASSNRFVIATWTNSPMAFYTNQTHRMTLDTSGNLGIGTTSPSSTLHVAATSLADNSTQALLTLDGKFNAASVDANDIVGINFKIINSSGGVVSNTLIGSSWSTQQNLLLAPSGGNVGIGTASPSAKLTVSGTSATGGTFTGSSHGIMNIEGDAYTANDVVAMTFKPSDYAIPFAKIASEFTSSGSYLRFGTSNNYSTGITNTAMTIDYNGNVGIGTTLPGTILEVEASDPVLKVEATGTNSASVLNLHAPGTGLAKIQRAGTDVITINSSNNVGIGTTTPWGQLSASSTSAYPALVIEQKSTGPAAIFLGGNVGIGTTNPGSILEIAGKLTLTGTSGYVKFANISGGAGGNAPTCNSTNEGTTLYNRDDSEFGYLYWCAQSSTNGTYQWLRPGSISTTNPDIAEYVRTNDLSMEVGDVVSVSDEPYYEDNIYNRFLVEKTTSSNVDRVLGIISTSTSFIINESSLGDTLSTKPDKTNLRPIALAGRVPVKATLENGYIKQGDYLTVSTTTPGRATKAVSAGITIGKALGPADENGMVLVYIVHSYYDPSVLDLGLVMLESSSSTATTTAPSLRIRSSMYDTLAYTGMRIGDKMASFVGLAADKFTATLAYLEKAFIKDLHIENKLCVDDVCVDKEQLKQMLVNAGGGVHALSQPTTTSQPQTTSTTTESTTSITSDSASTTTPTTTEGTVTTTETAPAPTQTSDSTQPTADTTTTSTTETTFTPLEVVSEPEPTPAS